MRLELVEDTARVPSIFGLQFTEGLAERLLDGARPDLCARLFQRRRVECGVYRKARVLLMCFRASPEFVDGHVITFREARTVRRATQREESKRNRRFTTEDTEVTEESGVPLQSSVNLCVLCGNIVFVDPYVTQKDSGGGTMFGHAAAESPARKLITQRCSGRYGPHPQSHQKPADHAQRCRPGSSGRFRCPRA